MKANYVPCYVPSELKNYYCNLSLKYYVWSYKIIEESVSTATSYIDIDKHILHKLIFILVYIYNVLI